MICSIPGCLHKQSRRGRINPHTNSWGKYGICPCCSNELIQNGTITDLNIAPRGCQYELQKEFEVPPKKNPKPQKKKFKSRYERTWIPNHGPPMPNELI